MQDITIYKILNGIKYFVKNTKYVGRTKLFKLLYFWDFFHFKKYGFSVTGYTYYTFPFGPVPKELYEQIDKDNLPSEFVKEFKIIPDDSSKDEFSEYKKFRIILKDIKIDLDWLSPIEKETLKNVADIFKYATGTEMSEITHLRNSPYDKTKKEFGLRKPIDYKLAFDNESTLDEETIKEYIELQKEIFYNGRFQ